MAKKTWSIKIDEDLHLEVKSAAPRRGKTLEGAYEQALRSWLRAGAGTTQATAPLDLDVLQMYDAQQAVREKVLEATKALEKVLVELRLAAKERDHLPRAVDTDSRDELDPAIAAEIENQIGRANRAEKDYREAEPDKGRDGKQPRRKIS